MMVRLWGWSAKEVYEFYNLGNIDEHGQLPPPPNPTGVQSFMLACLEEHVHQLNEENSPPDKHGQSQLPRRRR